MATTFRPHPNNVSTALAANYTAGSGSLVLAAGTGAAFGSTFPLTVTVAQAANVGLTTEVNTIFTVTGRTTDTLTGVAATEGTTDRAYAIGDRVEPRWTGGLATAIESAVNGVENSTGITGGVIATARLGTGTPAAPTANWLRYDQAWSSYLRWVNKSGSGIVGNADTFCLCDAAAGAFSLTLPSAAAVAGAEFIFWKNDTSANALTIARAGTDVIIPGPLTSLNLSAYGKSYRLLALASGVWVIVGST